jgi:hypothetical protein
MAALPILILLALVAAPARGAVLSVPAQYGTIQAAIGAAANGDVIDVAPGVYAEALVISGKTLTIRSRFATSGDPADVAATAIAIGGVDVVTLNAGADVLLQGLTLRTGQAAVRVNLGSRVEFVDGHVFDTSDGISLEGGTEASDPVTRAVIRRSLIEASSDDGVDADNKAEIWIEDSEIRGHEDDGVEIRVHSNDFAPGESIEIVFLRSRFTDCGEDGLQLIEYGGLSQRSFRIEGNVFANNAMAGLGITCANTVETFEGCQMPEPVRLVNNSFVGNDHGLVGGADLVGVNNLFAGNTTLGAKNVAGASLLAESLFFGNGTPHSGSNVDAASTLLADPLLTGAFLLQDGSPAIDAGAAFFQLGGEVIVDLDPGDYGGAAPDLGAFEWVPGTGPDPASIEVRVSAGADDAEQGVSSVALTGSDLELVTDGSVVQTVGLRFPNLALPPEATILAAWIQFRADETGSDAASLLVEAQAADDAPPFTTAAGNISARPRTSADVLWTPPPWAVVGSAGPGERTPDLSEIVQEIVDRPGWASGGAIAFIVTGSGRRTAESYEGLASGAPLLHVEYMEGGPPACANGLDDDGDSLTDHPLDPGCDAADDESERSAALPCDDGLDDDGDGGIDFGAGGDLGCASPSFPREDPQCQNGSDDDGDGRFDFDGGASANGGTPLGAADLHCSGPTDDVEAAPPPVGCGIGPELAVVLALLWRRRRRAPRGLTARL